MPQDAPAAQSKVTGSTGDWSSLIGIVTAIVGNILISFALNTQRYAHVRLGKEQLREKEAQIGFGAERERGEDVAIEARIAEQRSRVNASSDTPREVLDRDFEGHEGTETEALIPHISAPEQHDHGSGSGNGNNHGRLKEGTDHGRDDGGSADDNDNDEPKRKSYLRSPYWWLGISLMVIGEAGNFLAYGFAPASIVSPLGVVALISNCLVAPIMLGEHFRRRDLLGVVIAIGGAVTVVLSAQGSNPKLGPDEILKLVKRWEFLTYMGITIGAIVVLMILSNRVGSRFIVVDLGLVGLFGGYTALSTKGVASLLSYRLFRALTFPIFYVLVLVLVGTAVLQIKYVNRALQRFDSTRVIPTQFCTFTIFVIVGSAILYRDFESTTADKVGMFVGGCALTFLGVWFLTSGRRGSDDKDSGVQRRARARNDEENHIDLVDDEGDGDHDVDTNTIRGNKSTSASATSTLNSATTSNNSFSSALSSRPAIHTSATTPSPLTLHNDTTSSSSSSTIAATAAAAAATESSPLLSRTPATPSQRRRSEMLTPNTPGRPGGLTPTISTPGSNTPRSPLVSRESISRLGRGLGPLTGTLSGGLSVVVADQRGRMARGVGGGAGSSARREGEGERERWGSVDAAASADAAAADGGGSPMVSERPRIGRGTTVEVAGSSVPPPRRGSEPSDSGGGGVVR